MRICKLLSMVMISDGHLVDTAHLCSNQCAVSEYIGTKSKCTAFPFDPPINHTTKSYGRMHITHITLVRTQSHYQEECILHFCFNFSNSLYQHHNHTSFNKSEWSLFACIFITIIHSTLHPVLNKQVQLLN